MCTEITTIVFLKKLSALHPVPTPAPPNSDDIFAIQNSQFPDALNLVKRSRES